MHAKLGERADDPFLDRSNEAAHVGRAALEIEHDIADALAGTVIGELPAAAGRIHGKARVEELVRPGGGAGCVEGRVLEQPNQFPRLAVRNPGCACRHGGERIVIVDRMIAHVPLDRRRARKREKANLQIVARVNDPVTMPW